MESRILQVFYGNDCLPYKDKDRTIHYPIVGSTFTGANNTTQVRFYLRDVGGVVNIAWLVSVKLPNGKLGYQLLPSNTKVYDTELGEYYLPLDLSAYYTQMKGDIYISLNGYDGNADVEFNEDTGLWEVSGSPAIQVTGALKITINYAPQSLQTTEVPEDIYNAIIADLAKKIYSIDALYICKSNLPALALDNNFEDGQYVFYKQDHRLYKWDLANAQFVEVNPVVINSSLRLGNVNEAIIESLIVATQNNGVSIETEDGLDEVTLKIYQEDVGHFYVAIDGELNSTTLKENGKRVATKEYVENGNQVVVSGTSGTIGAADRATLTHDNSSIKNSSTGLIYRLVSASGNDRNFGVYYSTDNSGGQITWKRSYITVNTSTGAWELEEDDLDTTYDSQYIDTNYGKSLDIDSNYVLKLKNAQGTVISSVDLPLESIVTNAQYYDTYTYDGTTYTDVIVITLATTSVPTIIPVGDLVSGLVSTSDLNTALADYVLKSQTIAGIDLQDNITAQELTDALVYSNTTSDLDYVFTD